MYFEELRGLLLDRIRFRVHNGELTERGLARITGISQPHMHNVLKGKRLLSAEMADRLLYHLRVSVLDLIDPRVLQQYAGTEEPDSTACCYLPVLRGRLGPGSPWPQVTERRERFPVPFRATSRMWQPVIARLAEDETMFPLFARDDFALLDQSQRARTEIDPGGLYAIKRGNTGVLRRLRYAGNSLLVCAEKSDDAVDRIELDSLSISHFVRARAILIGNEGNWSSPDARIRIVSRPVERRRASPPRYAASQTVEPADGPH